ncbi:MAG: MFS transporter [Ornithinimicrobium sp.]
MSSVWTLRGMPALIGVTLTGFAGFAALLPTSPRWAVEGGANEAGAGFVNGVLLLFTVLTQLFVPGLLRRYGWGTVMSVGMVLMGLPALAHILSDALLPILALSAVRGVGFGILTVTGSAAVAELVDPARRGAAIGAYGLAIAVPNLVLLPLSPWVAQTYGFWIIFVVAALPLVGVPSVWALSRVLHDPPAAEPEGGVGQAGDLDAGGAADSPSTDPELIEAADSTPDEGEMSGTTAYLRLLRPTFLLLGATLSGGAVTTFAPQIVDSGPASIAALFGIGATAALARWQFGGLSDRFGAQRFMWPLTGLTVVAMALAGFAVLGDSDTALSLTLFVIAAGLVGISYGGLQNLTLVVAFDAVTPQHYRRASAVWNVGFDMGTGLGSVLVGLLAAGYGFSTALLVAAGISACMLPVAIYRPR